MVDSEGMTTLVKFIDFVYPDGLGIQAQQSADIDALIKLICQVLLLHMLSLKMAWAQCYDRYSLERRKIHHIRLTLSGKP